MKNVKNSNFSEISSLTSRHFPCSFLCHVTCVTYFNKWPDPDIRLANLLFSTALARQTKIYEMSTSDKYFHIFFFKIRYQNWRVKIGGMVVLQLI